MKILFSFIALLLLFTGCNTSDELAFYNALEKNNAPELERILKKHPEYANPVINTESSDRMTPLHDAVNKGYAESAEILLKYGANIEETDQNSNTALDLAKKSNNKKMMELLKKHGAKERGAADQKL
ncbi:MAG: ankyrin repeat domain-containing protein [Firmicutes bacterium]|nr:ankyrin repeat domain-containing protein [Bacillota bacterium]